jgi:predicted metal-binding membrane protein
MTARNDTDFDALDPMSASLAHGFSARRLVALVLIAALATLGWAYLAIMVASMAPGDVAALGPGMSLVERAVGANSDAFLRAVLASLCAMPQTAGWSLADLALVFLMWLAMIGAMMLPTAAPMITTYAEIADTAARHGKRVAPIAVVVGGYLTVWAGFAVLATLAQWASVAALVLTPHMTAASPVLVGALFLVAGIYQFTPLKHACLTRCRTPFPVLFGRWSERPADVYRLGLDEGINCLGCCWALMLLMFAVGVMNIVWMVALAIVSMVERLTTGRTIPNAVGVVLVLIGLATWGGFLLERGVIRL